MSAKKSDVAIVGIGAAACIACCAAPIGAALAAIGLGTAAGVALFGIGALLVSAVAVAWVLHRRRRARLAASQCGPDPATPVTISPRT